MQRLGLFVLSIAASVANSPAPAQEAIVSERVTIPSPDGQTKLAATLMRNRTSGAPRPALVLLHGCTGLQEKGRVFPVYQSWAERLTGEGYVVLLVDSAASRGLGETCTESAGRDLVLHDRPKDAYAALKFLQARDDVQPNRIGVVGWSQGGATILRAIASNGNARPETLEHDFRAAVALYPGACSERLHTKPFVDAKPHSWTTKIPLLVLVGEADNWTPAKPCIAFIEDAKARGASVELKTYPGAYHVFDAPSLKLRELPHLRRPDGVVPSAGTNPAALADARVRVPEFLRRHLRE